VVSAHPRVLTDGEWASREVVGRRMKIVDAITGDSIQASGGSIPRPQSVLRTIRTEQDILCGCQSAVNRALRDLLDSVPNLPAVIAEDLANLPRNIRVELRDAVRGRRLGVSRAARNCCSRHRWRGAGH
jgi:hypothetical protein